MVDDDRPQGGEDTDLEDGQTGEGEGPAPYEPSPYDDLARDMGWTPPDKFNGPPEAFKTAEQFIRDTNEIKRANGRELRTLEAKIDTLTKTSAQLAEEAAQRRFNELGARYTQAVEDDNKTEAFRIAGEMHNIAAPTIAPPPGPVPEAQDWEARNQWFQSPRGPKRAGTSATASALAMDVCANLAAKGYDTDTQLKEAEKEVRRQYPELFGSQGMNGTKPAPGVHTPSSRGPSQRSRDETYAALPPEAKKIAEDMISRGVIKKDNPDEARAYYAKLFYANERQKAQR